MHNKSTTVKITAISLATSQKLKTRYCKNYGYFSGNINEYNSHSGRERKTAP